jgi:hypothetical protein
MVVVSKTRLRTKRIKGKRFLPIAEVRFLAVVVSLELGRLV